MRLAGVGMKPRGTTRRTALLAALAVIGLVAQAQEGGLPAKQPGVVRVGLVKPKVQTVGSDAGQVADAMRNTFAEFLGGPSQEVVLLSARALSQAIEEGRLAECDYVLFATLAHKRGGGGGMLGEALNNVAGAASSTYIPGGNPIATAAVSSVLGTAADYATQIQERDEMRLEYRLQPASSGKPLLEMKHKAKAQSDGEDLLTPLVEGAAEEIAHAIGSAGQ